MQEFKKTCATKMFGTPYFLFVLSDAHTYDLIQGCGEIHYGENLMGNGVDWGSITSDLWCGLNTSFGYIYISIVN